MAFIDEVKNDEAVEAETAETESVEVESIELETDPEPVHPLGDRLTFALRQALLVSAVVFVVGLLAEGNLPAEAVARDVVGPTAVMTIAAWVVLLLFHAIAFERSEMQRIEGLPMLGAIAIGTVAFLIGAATFDAGSTSDRLLYVGLNSVGVVLFWLAAIGIVQLLWLRVSRDYASS